MPERRTLPALREAVQGCRGCDLHRDAAQAVMGSGEAGAAVMLLGEQPGDQEVSRRRAVRRARRPAARPAVGAHAVPRPPEWVLATIHPSAVLRSREREETYHGFVADLRVGARSLAG